MTEKTKLENKVGEFSEKISAIQKAVRQIKRTGINENVLYSIIQKNSQRFVTSRYAKPLTMGDVRAIIAGIESLTDYMFPEETQ